jgi:Zn-dependent protease with chaperone function
VRLDSANRSFLAIVGIALLLGAYVLCGAMGSVLVPLLIARVSRQGLDGLVSGSLLPALPFLAMVAVGLVLASHSLAQQLLASRRLGRRIRDLEVSLTDELAQAAAEAGLGGRLALIDAAELFSFAHGVLGPRVAVSRGLLEGTSIAELRAVLEHERYHVANLDPLKIVFVQALSRAFFFLPILKSLRARYVAGRELAADRRAVRICGRPPLAGALLKVLAGPAWSELTVAVPIGDPSLLAVRVAQLETGVEPKLDGFDAPRAIASLVGACSLIAVFLASASGLGGNGTVSHTAGAELASAALRASLSCTLPFAGAGLLAYLSIAVRASGTLRSAAHEARGLVSD